MMSKEGLKEIAEYADGIGPWTDQVLDQNGKQKQSETVVNANLVKDSHENNLLVHPYTVRKDELPKYVKSADEVIRKFLYEVKVDGIFTDFTDIGVKVRNEGK